MIPLSPEAEAQLAAFERMYRRLGRPLALRNLAQALSAAQETISAKPAHGLAAPSSYPELAEIGLRWLKTGRYWVAYDVTDRIIAGIFFETDDIPARLRG